MIMDCVSAAASLKKLLVAHDAAVSQVSALGFYRLWLLRRLTLLSSDDQISDVSQQTLASALEGNKSQDLHLSLRLSVSEGVKVMYNNYQHKKWSQVQEMARSIIQNLEGDLDTEQTTSPLVTSPSNRTVDKAADKWSMAFCEFYRDS